MPALIKLLVYMVIFVFYTAGLITFGVFVSKEETSTNAKTGIWTAIVTVIILMFFFRILAPGAMVAACFYVADKKNRSRLWALAGLLVGPVALLPLIAMRKLQGEETLTLNLNSGPDDPPQ